MKVGYAREKGGMKFLVCPLKQATKINKTTMTLKCKSDNCDKTHEHLDVYMPLRLRICTQVDAYAIKRVSGTAEHYEIPCEHKKGVKQAFDTLTKKSDLTLEKLIHATDQTISPSTLLESANLAIMLDLPTEKLDALFRSAYVLGRSVGLAPDKAITSLCKGVGRRSRLILDNIGIVFNAQDAYKAFPKQGKSKAWQLYAIKQIEEKARCFN